MDEIRQQGLPALKSFLVCRDVLVNSRSPNVISIINIFNELRPSRYPAPLGTICLVCIYSGAVGRFTHRYEMWERDIKIGEIPDQEFFLEDPNALFHVTSHMDGMVAEGPRHIIFKAICNEIEVGRQTLGVFKPLHGLPKDYTPGDPPQSTA